MINTKLEFEEFRLNNIIVSGLVNYLWGHDVSFDSEIEKECSGELCDTYYLCNRDNGKQVYLTWKGAYYELKTSNIALKKIVSYYIKQAYQNIQKSEKKLLEAYSREGNLQEIEYLYHKKINATAAIFFACEQGHIKLIKYYQSKISNSKQLSKGLSEGLIYACRNQQLETIMFILNHKFCIKKKDLKKCLSFALTEVTNYNDLDLVDLLIENGAKVVLHLNDYYETALHAVARTNNTEILLRLLNTKCELEPWNSDAYTPFEIASFCQSNDVIEILESKLSNK